ncbi:unnamed protein product, partial [Prorocentrum cordatum]
VQARAASRASSAWQLTRGEARAWAVADAAGSMKEAYLYSQKPEQRAMPETPVNPGTLEDLDEVAQAALPERSFCAREHPVAASRSCCETAGQGSCHRAARRVQALSGQDQEGFINPMKGVEGNLEWAHQPLHKRLALLPKWSKQWLCRRDREAARWGAAVRGSLALQAVLLRMVLDEARLRCGAREQADFLLDAERFHGIMDLALMAQRSIESEFPPAELYLCSLACLASRVVVSRGAFGTAPVARVRQCVDGVHAYIEGPGPMLVEQSKVVTVPRAQGCLVRGIRVYSKSLVMMARSLGEINVQRLEGGGYHAQPDFMPRIWEWMAPWDSGSKSMGVMLHDADIGAKCRHSGPALGVSASVITSVRARAADLAGLVVGGRCAASVLLLHCRSDGSKMAAFGDEIKQRFQFWVKSPRAPGQGPSWLELEGGAQETDQHVGSLPLE